MDNRLTSILLACFIGLAVVTVRWARKTGEWRPFWIGLVPVVAYGIFLNRWFGFPFEPHITGKGGSDLVLAGALGICMIVGMLAQYLYRHFERQERNRTKWDWGCFIAPIFASPIIFIPLAAAFQNADIDLAKQPMTLPRLMIFLVAFENGFFWKEYFDRKRKEVGKGA
jgi:peptidoglycan biosynthesis protein MviN/MurJ (putative lipid II flippase)